MFDFDFAYPYLLFLLGSILLFIGLYWLARQRRKKKLQLFGRPDIVSRMMPDASIYKPNIKIVLQLIAIAAIVLVLARPRYGEKDDSARVEGIEVMIAFDVSNSMLASATDDASGISRINRARLLLEKLIGRLDNDRVGLVIFAGEASMEVPLTTDLDFAKSYLTELDPATIEYQGTSIADAINMSAACFTPDDNVHKAIILITDAENHIGDEIEAATDAAERGIQIDVVGVGTPKGGPIPLGANGEYMRDYDNEVVITKFNEEAAKEIAKAGKGVYVNGDSSDALDTLIQTLDELDKSELQNVEYKASAEQFPTFAWLALIFLVIDMFITDNKNGWLKNINFFNKDARMFNFKRKNKAAQQK